MHQPKAINKNNPKSVNKEILNNVQMKLKSGLSEICLKYPVASLALFGSVLRDDFDPEKSDIDILVEFNGDIGWEFFDLEAELGQLIGRKVDLVSRRGLKPYYWENIKNEVQYV